MAITNRDRVGKALEVLGDGLAPFVERELKSALSTNWQEALTDGSLRCSASCGYTAKKRITATSGTSTTPSATEMSRD